MWTAPPHNCLLQMPRRREPLLNPPGPALDVAQARAFGRRLPWSALVPMADCLNHSNVQTKYDYDVGGNGVFRLFPTGDNRYGRGTEVFNSYGRRSNAHLLLDYGFALLDNEWDLVELPFPTRKCPEAGANAAPPPPLSLAQRTLLLRAGVARHGLLVGSKCFCWDALTYLRVSAWEAETVAHATRTNLDVGKARGQEEELQCLDAFDESLGAWLGAQATSVEEDEALLEQARQSGRDNAVSAITYRLTRKRVVERQRVLVAVVRRMAGALRARAKAREDGLASPPSASGVHDELPPLLTGEADRITTYLRCLAFLPLQRPPPPSPPEVEGDDGAEAARRERSDSPDVMIKVKLPPPLVLDGNVHSAPPEASATEASAPAWTKETVEG